MPFVSCNNTQYVVGHTHNRQDQRIGVVCTGIARTPRLEDPNDVVQCIKRSDIPTKGRESVAELINATLDFQNWFEALGLDISGHDSHHFGRTKTRRAVTFGGLSSAATCQLLQMIAVFPISLRTHTLTTSFSW